MTTRLAIAYLLLALLAAGAIFLVWWVVHNSEHNVRRRERRGRRSGTRPRKRRITSRKNKAATPIDATNRAALLMASRHRLSGGRQ